MSNVPSDSSENQKKPLVGMDPRKVLAGVLQSSACDSDRKGWEPPSEEYVESLLTNYKVLSLIGRGGMGAVYKVEHKELQRVCALKLLPIAVSERPDFEERFLREARAMASLQHPNIVHIYDFGRGDEGHLYYVMEYVEGADLACLIRDGRVGSREALLIVSQVAEALAYAHDQGYVHRDVKPGNVLLDDEGKVKVVDFGLAKIMHEQELDPTMTLKGEVMGTLGYMSPEQTQGGEVDHRSDIYALGVMLYELLTGALPQGHFELPSQKVGADESLDKVVLRALHQSPERRYQSAVAVKDALSQCGDKTKGISVKKRKRLKPIVLSLLLIGGISAGIGVFLSVNQGSPVGAQNHPKLTESYTNSLGTTLVPVRGTQVLVGKTETLCREWDLFLDETGYDWQPPSFNLPGDHAVVNISWRDAQEFCDWLTEKERREGKVGPQMSYRIPTDREWSASVGLIEEQGETPEQRGKQGDGMFLWGGNWPPPEAVRNEIDIVESDVFEVMEGMKRSYQLMMSPMNLGKIKELKSVTYWLKHKHWRVEATEIAPDFVYLPEHTARVMQTATDQAQFRHWKGKTIVLMHRWLARHAEVALPMVGWQFPDWRDGDFRAFFTQQDWGYESGLSIFTPTQWDQIKGRWKIDGKAIPMELFKSSQHIKRAMYLRLNLENGELKFEHDNRQHVCYPVVVFDGILDQKGIQREVEKAYLIMQKKWYKQAAQVCEKLLPSYEHEWQRQSQPVEKAWENKFGIRGSVGGAKEWVLDTYAEENEAVKTLRGGAIRLLGRGPSKMMKSEQPTESVEKCVEDAVLYAVSARNELQATYREGQQADERRPWYGFRVVLDLGAK